MTPAAPGLIALGVNGHQSQEKASRCGCCRSTVLLLMVFLVQYELPAVDDLRPCCYDGTYQSQESHQDEGAAGPQCCLSWFSWYIMSCQQLMTSDAVVMMGRIGEALAIICIDIGLHLAHHC